ncbi:MAG TPA: FtsX-like permease family protein, partial [Ktedonobacterales bacterium]
MRARQVRTGRVSVRAAAALRLGVWRLRPAWRLLVVVQVGMIAALLVVCAVPLFSRVATYAGLQGALEREESDRQLTVDVGTNVPSPELMRQVDEHVAKYVSANLAGVDIRLQGAPDVMMSSGPLNYTQPAATTKGALAQAAGLNSSTREGNGAPLGTAISAQPLSSRSGGIFGGISLFAYSRDQLTKRVRLLEGHLPQARQDGIEILITEPTASKLHLGVGSHLPLAVAPGETANPLVLYVAGIVVSTAPGVYPNFDPYYGPLDTQPSYYAVADSGTITHSTYPWSSLALKGPPGPGGCWDISWTYQLDVSRLTPDRTRTLLQTEAGQEGSPYSVSLPRAGQQETPANGDTVYISTELYSALERFQQNIVTSQIVVDVLLLAIVGLLVLCVAQMSGLLIARQEAFIALLRSRGASRRQIFATFASQGMTLVLVAILAGPLLAVPLIRQVALVLFRSQRQSVTDALAGNPITLGVSLLPVVL